MLVLSAVYFFKQQPSLAFTNNAFWRSRRETKISKYFKNSEKATTTCCCSVINAYGDVTSNFLPVHSSLFLSNNYKTFALKPQNFLLDDILSKTLAIFSRTGSFRFIVFQFFHRRRDSRACFTVSSFEKKFLIKTFFTVFVFGFSCYPSLIGRLNT